MSVELFLSYEYAMYNSRNKDKIQIHKQYIKKKTTVKEHMVFSNKKKIRNWPTILKKLQLLTNENLFGSAQEMEDIFKRSNYNYMKLYIDPFSRIEKTRNPPQWFRKLIIQSFVEVYNNWHLHAENLKKPYYLKLWIADKDFSSSQIVMGYNDRIEHYENLFKLHEINKPFPHEQYSSEHCDTTQFNWQYAKECTLVEKVDLDTFSTKYLNKLFKENLIQPYYGFKDIYPDKEMFLIHVDNLWIGERIVETPTIALQKIIE